MPDFMLPKSATVAGYPEGAAGIRVSLEAMAEKIREGRLDPTVRAWTADALRAAGIDGRGGAGTAAKAAAILDALRAQVIYVQDPAAAEYIPSAAATLCLRKDLCIKAEDCFPEGTLLLRDDFTFVPVEEIEVGDRIWGKDRWTTVQATKFKGRLQVDAVEMNNGSTMYLTSDHKVYVGRCKHNRGAECPTCYPGLRKEDFVRIPVGDLREGEVLLQPERIDFGSLSPDPDRTYVEGLCLADGWVRDSCKSFYVSGRDGMRKEAQKHEVKAICEKLGIKTHWYHRYIAVHDEAWALRLMRLGKRARFKHLETINLTEASATAALRGVMADSTPSCVRYPDGSRTYSTTSFQMMLQVRVLQRMFGVSTSVKMLTPEQHGGAGKHPLWRVATRQSNKGEKTLAVRSIERAVQKMACWDIQTEDHYVYLPEHDVTVSNCDGLTVALSSAYLSIGIPAVIVKQSFGGGAQEHVLAAVQDEYGNWLYADPSTRLPLGSAAAAQDELWVDPLAEIGALPEQQAQIVTLGEPRRLHSLSGVWTEDRHGRIWRHDEGVWKSSRGLGDIFGYHTAHELAVDLLNWQGFVTVMATSVAEDGDKWKSADAAGWSAWLRDWNAFRAKWDKAAAVAQAAVEDAKNSLRGWDWITAEDEYQGALQAFQNGTTPSPGGFDDLYRRWVQAAKAPAPQLKVSLDPNAAPDAMLITYQSADQAIKAVENAAAAIKDPASFGLVSALVGAAVAVGVIVVIKKIL